MTSEILMPLHSGFKKICLIYDFSQVNDAILIVIYNNELHYHEKLVVNYYCGNWIADKSFENDNLELFFKTNNRLQEIFSQHKKTFLQEFSADHVLLLLNACS